MRYLKDCICTDCQSQQLAAGGITLEYLTGILTGKNEPLQFPVTYPAIDFDKETKKMFYIGFGVIAASIIVGSIAAAQYSKK